MLHKYFLSILLFCATQIQAQTVITLEKVVNEWSLASPTAQKAKLTFENTLLNHKNYLKEFLPSISFALNPISFNHSLRLMQSPEDGSYSYVNDYSNSSNTGVTLQQKIGPTGGTLFVSSNLNMLTEFSRRQYSFNTTPLTITYSQELFGGYHLYKKKRKLEQAKYDNATKQYCSEIADIQTKALNAFLNVFLTDLTKELALKNIQISDTLMKVSKALLEKGNLTEYEYKQAELQANNNLYIYETALKDWQNALRTLWTFLGKEEAIDSILVKAPIFSLPLEINFNTVNKYARQNSPFTLTQKIKRLEAEQTLFTTKLNNRFNGNIIISYGLNQYANRFSEAYRQPSHSQGVTIGFQIPIFQWGINRNKIRIAQNNYESSIIELQESEDNFSNELKDKVSAYNHDVKLFFLSKQSYQLAQEQYEILSRKFQYSRVSVYEISSIQTELYEAMKRYYASMQAVWNQFYLLRKITLYDFTQQCELTESLLKR
ncbi:TolC family protein [Bacteroides acidifaciens]|jgi:outer membrane protein TolC|uniref:TolC family protein n=1 Tax=Bacteroides acidifaciens TaxID=85831 RepID=A0A7K3MHZ5_9BACE|nr:TolC family protein [Bacteroides acidifaciens]MBF0730371.1 TolC family protein [Bacteroides acidifaciens]MBF0837514.1 TolC family protein [Bacteroides acidifaciens]NDO53948.1 TolC family protein [Bacteroides acidifaciens]TFU48642.1 TolC family protein [Bacteroides acidifaciens]